MSTTDLEGELEMVHESSFRWALCCCRWNREDAQDVLQTSYLKILEGKARFDGRSNFRTFLFGVIRRTAAEQRRRDWLARLRVARWSRLQVASPFEPEAEHRNESSERASRLLAALAKLAKRQCEVLELVFYHGLTVEEAAAALGISVGSARVHYARGKKRLWKALNG